MSIFYAKQKYRQGLVIIWLFLLFAGITSIFWYNEWVYSLPTPVPQNYKAVKMGTPIDISSKLNSTGKPVFLHFFNPDCPCSKFNIPHFKSLVKSYGSKADFAVVVISPKHFTPEQIQNKFDLQIPVLFDTTLATACGVYSTPQAVLLDASHKLYYRGNYNKSRYCSDNSSNYAQMAIDSLLTDNSNPVFSPYALTAYGCGLPNCNK